MAKKTGVLPGEVVIRSIPSGWTPMPGKIDDTMKGVDKQIKSDNSKRNKNYKPSSI